MYKADYGYRPPRADQAQGVARRRTRQGTGYRAHRAAAPRRAVGAPDALWGVA